MEHKKVIFASPFSRERGFVSFLLTNISISQDIKHAQGTQFDNVLNTVATNQHGLR